MNKGSITASLQRAFNSHFHSSFTCDLYQQTPISTERDQTCEVSLSTAISKFFVWCIFHSQLTFFFTLYNTVKVVNTSISNNLDL